MAVQFIGSEFIVNTTTAGQQRNQSVAALADGGFVVTWQSQEGATTNHNIVGQVFDADRNPVGSEFIVNTTTSGDQRSPVVTVLASGGFVVTWDSSPGAGLGFDIFARVFNADGTPATVGGSTNDFKVNTTGAVPANFSDQTGPTISALPGGGFVVTFTSRDGGFSNFHTTRARVYDADGLPVSVSGSANDFVVNTTPGAPLSGAAQVFSPSVATLPDGRFVVTWTSGESGFDIRGRIFNADGTAAGNDFIVNSTTGGDQLISKVTALPDGRFVVTWSDNGSTSGDIRARIFNSDGTPTGTDFIVNTTTANSQSGPHVAALADGRIAFVWTSDEGGASSLDIRGRIFNADGTAAGADFLINTVTANQQLAMGVTALADGRLIVTWFDNDTLTGEQNIRAQILALVPDNPTITSNGGDATAAVTIDENTTAVTDVNATDPDGDAEGAGLSYSIVLPGAGGAADGALFTIDSGAGALSFLSAPDFEAPADAGPPSNTYEVTVRVTDSTGLTDDQTITATVADVAEAITNGNGGGTLNGTPGNDFIDAQGGNDVINAGAGDDTVLAGSGNDIVNAGDGNDTVTGGSGSDAVFGGNGNDTFIATIGDGNDLYSGGAGTDTLDMSAAIGATTINLNGFASSSSQFGFDILVSIENAIGGPAEDRITGTGAANVLDGREGEDIINAGGGADTVIGGAGNDTMNGGPGNDTFVFQPGFGIDTILGFDANPIGGQDLMDLRGLGITAAMFAFQVDIQNMGGSTSIIIGADSIHLENVVAGRLNQSDFILL